MDFASENNADASENMIATYVTNLKKSCRMNQLSPSCRPFVIHIIILFRKHIEYAIDALILEKEAISLLVDNQ